MNYREELKKYLKNVEGHLLNEHSEESYSESVLFGTAMELSYSNQIGDKIASIVLFHQITISMMKLLIIRCNFLTKLLIFPHEMVFKKMKNDESYSTVLRTLENHISFLNKGKFLSLVQELNSLRTRIVHDMHNTEVDVFVFENTQNLQKKFEDIWNICLEATKDLHEKTQKAIEKEEIQRLITNGK